MIHMLRKAGYSVMAILRMLLALDVGRQNDLRAALDTPPAGEGAINVADRWLSTLAEVEQRALDVIQMLEDKIAKSQP